MGMDKRDDKENLSGYPQEIADLINDAGLLGRMNDHTSAAYLKGPCGDEMEFYLIIENNRITEIKYFTEGCVATKLCAAMTAALAKGRTVDEALSISSAQVIKKLSVLPQDHLHCSILAVSTLYRAIADYLLRI